MKTKSHWLHTLMLSVTLFGSAALHSENNDIYLIYIISAVTIGSLAYLFVKPGLWKLLLRSKFLWWFLTIFLSYIISIDYDEQYAFFIAAVILNTAVWFISIPVRDSMEILIKSSAIAAIGLCVFVGINEGELIQTGMIRIGSSASGNVNSTGLWLGVFSTLCLYRVLIKKSLIYKGAYAVQVVFMLLTGSKKALLFIFMSLTLLPLLKEKLKIYKYVFSAVLIAGIYYLIMNNSYLYPIIGQRVSAFTTEMGWSSATGPADGSTATRADMLRYGWQLFTESPISGHGRRFFETTSGFGAYSHNNYIELLVSYGIAGFTLYYGMFIYILMGLFKQLKNDHYSMLFFALTLIIMASDLAVVSFYNSPCSYIVLLFAWLLINPSDRFDQNRGTRLN